ncbi:MAG: hypothetical protein ACXWWC_07155 [Chitinophagaceae bacterium]
MKKYKILLPLFITLFFLATGFIQKNNHRIPWKNKTADEDTWSGTVSYFNKITGPKIILSEWKMDATINNNTVTATNEFNFANTLGDVAECKGRDTTVQEVISIDYEEKEYYIDVQIPPCRGTATTSGVTEPYGATDETGIVVSKQKLKTTPDIISDSLILRDGPDGGGNRGVTIYKWNLVRSGKKRN